MARMKPTLCLAVTMAVSAAMAIQAPPEPAPLPDVDVRLPRSEAERASFRMRVPTPIQRAAAASLAGNVSGLVLRWDGLSAAPRWISSVRGRLSSARALPPDEAARAFLHEREALVGVRAGALEQLRVTSVVPGPAGSWHVHFAQWHDGMEVFGARTDVNLNADGSVRSLGAQLFAGLGRVGAPQFDALEAVRRAVDQVYPEVLFTGRVVQEDDTPDLRTVYAKEGMGRRPEARLVLFPVADGARLAWQVRLAEASLRTSYLLLIDALDGTLLFRRNETLHADARILDATAPGPQSEEVAPAQHLLVTLPASTPESPNGYLDGDGTSLSGNNATSHERYYTEPGLTDAAGLYDYPYNTYPAGLVNAWYWVNRTHDLFYAAGFDEAAGNFQTDNFGLGGVGGDALAVVQWSRGSRNNAFFTASIDGELSTVNFLWVNCIFCGDHDGFPENGGERDVAFMREVIVHEVAHGVTTRMVGGPGVSDCIYGTQSGGMGEGWGDLFAGSFFDEPQIGDHFFEGLGWMRDLRHDLTYAQVCQVGDSGCVVHYEGMIWAGTLWDLRRSMVALEPATGREDFERLIVEGLASTVCNPSMLDARDGILDADTTLFGSAHHTLIWNVFAARGMGSAASTTGDSDTAPVADFTVPAGMECSAPAAPTGLVASDAGANDVQLDYGATGASAVEIWREDLDNPLGVARRIDTTTDLAVYHDTSVQGSRSYRYHVVALGTGGVACASAPSATADVTASGSCAAEQPFFEPSLSITNGDPSCVLTLNWSAATPACAGDPIVYNVYAASYPGFEPSQDLLVGRTTATSFQTVPPAGTRGQSYLILAQRGTLEDAPDHDAWGDRQRLQWVTAIPTSPRTVKFEWDFDTGPADWLPDNSADPAGGWVLTATPIPTRYGDSLLAPDEPAGGTGQSWVTGDNGATPATVTEQDVDGEVRLRSPNWDGTSGATLLSFDYWAHHRGLFSGGLAIDVVSDGTVVRIFDIGMMTSQRYETAGRHGWQRHEVDLAQYVTPGPAMSVTFVAMPNAPLSEFGIDNVRIESASICARSRLVIDSYAVDDTPAGWGNGNGIAEPGETVRLAIDVRNDGAADAVTPSGTIVTAAAGILIHEPSDTFPDVPIGGTGSSAGTGFTLTLPDTFTCDDAFGITLEFTDAAGTTLRERLAIEFGSTVSETVFSDDFETDKGWTVQGAPAGQGMWERGTPIAGGLNPTACAGGTSCFVTGLDGSLPDHDVDGTMAELYSPPMDMTGYKRSQLEFMHYFQDDSTDADYWQDWDRYGVYIDDGLLNWTWSRYTGAPTSGWEFVSFPVELPGVPNARVLFHVLDRNENHYSSATDSTVEMAVDDVAVIGERQVCTDLGITQPPNGIGATLRVEKDAPAGETGTVSWSPSPVDATHDAAAYYSVHRSAQPDAGFAEIDTATGTSAALAFPAGTTYYLVTAANAAGVSPDQPAP